MTFKPSLLKRALFLLLALQLAGLTPLLSVPKAHALFWEDDSESNDPKDIKQRPTGFFLIDWIEDLNENAKREKYKEMDDHDRGPGVNGDSKTLLMVTSGLVGLGLGLFTADRLSEDSSDKTSNMFIGGALGLGVGIAIGAFIAPNNYEVDRNARIEYMKDRQALLQDPVRMEVAKAFQPPQIGLSLGL